MFGYLIKEGFRNTWVNRMMSVASIAVLLSCLVIIGSASMVFLNVESLVSRVEKENVIMVYISDDTDEAGVEQLKQNIEKCGNIQKIEFVSKESAWEQQLKQMEDAQKKFFEDVSSDIPLPDAYKVTVKDLTKFKTTVTKIKKLDNIDNVRENSNLAKKINTISQALSLIAVVIIAVLFAISLFIIANTIRLTVYSRRLEISIMKSVGATNNFIRTPFVVEGAILGIISGVISTFAVWGIYELATTKFADLFSSLGLTPLQFIDYIGYMLGAFIVIGIISGVGGSLITMRKYLNKEGSEISAV